MLIKPVSGGCNMNCDYCFYRDVSRNRETFSYGAMSEDTLETLVQKVFEAKPDNVSLAFQGGEPTLRGLGFYERLAELVSLYNSHGAAVAYSIQTNGYCIDEGWAKLLARDKYLVGISLDGTKDIHNHHRTDRSGEGTHSRVLRSIGLLKKYGVDYNILTVVTSDVVKHIDGIYSFYKKNGFKYLQFIPCIEDFGSDGGHTLSSELYGTFLKRLFDYWYRDIENGDYTFIRFFDSLMFSVVGRPSPDCGMNGRCRNQMVVEADGSVYPCDFYVLDKYRIGNILTDSLDTLMSYEEYGQFIREGQEVNPACEGCEWYFLCRGGCRRDRQTSAGLELNRYCSAYKEFFEYSSDRLKLLGKKLTAKQIRN
ncbi:MAG: anaerobic sulfatase maturase [Eubacteriales bacterium]